MDFSETLKTILLAGVGVVAKTAEVTKDVVDDLVKQGSITVEEGKVLAEQMKDKAAARRAETILNAVVKMTPEERADLWAKVQQRDAEAEAAADAAVAEAEAEAAEAAGEAPAETEEAPAQEPASDSEQ